MSPRSRACIHQDSFRPSDAHRLPNMSAELQRHLQDDVLPASKVLDITNCQSVVGGAWHASGRTVRRAPNRFGSINMAIVRFDGERVRAEPIRKQGTGWIMRSLQYAARLVPGTEFFVFADDVITMTPPDDGRPGAVADSRSNIDAAMAKERETLPTPAEVIKGNPPIAHDAPGKVEGT